MSSIRPARASDRADIVQLGAAVFAGFGDYRRVLRRWTENPAMQTLVATNDAGHCIGFATLALTHEPSGVVAHLLAIGVDPARRGAGVGGRLLDASLAEVRGGGAEWGVRELRLEVAASNARARSLFSSRGFVSAAQPTASYAAGIPALTLRLEI